MSDLPTLDLPAIYHEHDGPTEHKHENTGPGHYMGPNGHYHLTEVFTADEIAVALGIAEGQGNNPADELIPIAESYIVTTAASKAGKIHISEADDAAALRPLCRARYRPASQEAYRNAKPGPAAEVFNDFIILTTTYDGRVASYRCPGCWERGLRLKWPTALRSR